MPSQRGLEALRAFVQAGTVSGAALKMSRTQPQVGRLLTSLESELGFSLFVRRGHRLWLTEQGRTFYRQAERTMNSLDNLDRTAAQIRRTQSNHVSILTAPYVTQVLISDTLAIMARESPTFSATLQTRVRRDIEQWVGDESFDLAVTVLPLVHPAFEVEEFLRIEAVATMHKEHPLARKAVIKFDDLFDVDLIVAHSRSIIRQHIDQLFNEAGVEPNIRFEATNGLIGCQLAARGLGVCIADPFVARSADKENLVIRRFRPVLELPYGLVFPIWQPRSDTVMRLTSLIKTNATQRARQIEKDLAASERAQN
ncbi:MAG: LysR substrate-binding domain-containing protein [Nitrosospira sp.]|nr:LysR substrate-binding domain-containing protein [Nitrosospira sp.]